MSKIDMEITGDVREFIGNFLIKNHPEYNMVSLNTAMKNGFKRGIGVSLSGEACGFLINHFTSYEFDFSKKDFRPKHHLKIGRHFKLPYYVGLEKFVLFDKYMAINCELCGGLDAYLESLA